MRKDDPASVSAEDLHRLLVVARWAVIERIVQKLYTVGCCVKCACHSKAISDVMSSPSYVNTPHYIPNMTLWLTYANRITHSYFITII